LLRRRHPGTSLFPYTTLFRSGNGEHGGNGCTVGGRPAEAGGGPVRPGGFSSSKFFSSDGYLDFASKTVSAGKPGAGFPCAGAQGDRKSTRLNSSHVSISYAVF